MDNTDKVWIKIPEKKKVPVVPIRPPEPKKDEDGNVIKKQTLIAEMLRRNSDAT